MRMRPLPKPILIVDDDGPLLAMLRDLFESEGFTVITATDGVEAFEQLALTAPCLILCDFNMPLLDGEHFLQILRSRQSPPPILIMSAEPTISLWAAEQSAQGFLEKPFDLDALLAAVRPWWAEGNPDGQ